MGSTLSTPSPNPSDTQIQNTPTTTTMAASPTPLPEKQPEKIEPTTDSSETLEGPQNPVQQEAAASDPPPVDDDSSKSTEKNEDTNANEEGEEEEEEEGECGFCLFMKGGGCRDSFTDWEKCIEEAEKNNEDIVDKCADITGALKKCMEAHSDYYAPILRAEKAAEEEAVRELEKEKAKELEGSDDAKIEAS